MSHTRVPASTRRSIFEISKKKNSRGLDANTSGDSIDKCVADTVRALIGCRITFYNEAARGDIYFTQSVVRARVSEAPVDLLGRERRATA